MELSNQEYEHEDTLSISKEGEDEESHQDAENPNHDAVESPGQAENLVRNEARAIHFLRGAVLVLLVAAATLTGTFTYKNAAKNENDSFTQDFQNIAGQLVLTFENGIGSYLYQAYTLSEAISGGVFVSTNPNLPEETLANFDGLASSLRLQARALDIIWSPLLRTRGEKDSWERYATITEQSLRGSSTAQSQPCYLCGEGNEIANPSNLIQVPALGTFSCESVEHAALSGFLTNNYCTAGLKVVPTVCGCQKSNGTTPQNVTATWTVSDGIFYFQNGTKVPDLGPAPFSPVWQVSPSVAAKGGLMFNQMSDTRRRKALNAMVRYSSPVLSESFDPATDGYYKSLQQPTAAYGGLVGALFYPVYNSSQSNEIAGSLAVDFSWKLLFEIGLSELSGGIVLVLENSCGQKYTFKVIGSEVVFLGVGDLHDTSFDSLEVSSTVDNFLKLLRTIAPRGGSQALSSNWGCTYQIKVYPSTDMQSRYLTSKPWVETSIVVFSFVFTSLIFLLYDFIVRRLQAKVINSAKRSEAIVSSLFPAVVRDRLYEDEKRGQPSSLGASSPSLSRKTPEHFGHGLLNHKIRLKRFLAQPLSSEELARESEPIADLFPYTTIIFADIAGFTAWSSEREPAQVFKLLETLYGAFDHVAKRLGIFKIETIGDCYVAVSGLPDPREDHAVVMARFAGECLLKTAELTKKLESSLGPGTADLSIRVGLHSGPVTGGVLRGERARFQLFGNTMNIASRMESTGQVNKIHVSKETADLLINAGKSDWVDQRNDQVVIKGKGEMQTYWVKPLKPSKRKTSSCSSDEARSSNGHTVDTAWGATNLDSALAVTSSLSSRRDRLIEWNVDLLEQFLQKIVAKRKASVRSRRFNGFLQESTRQTSPNVQVLAEIAEVIRMPKFDEQTAKAEMNHTLVDIGSKVRSQLMQYVTTMADLYHENAFHNFEHASHVVMSASKLLKRIIAPDDVDCRTDEFGKTLKSNTVLSKEIHDTTYGISSDPLMQFALVLSALVHDVDHTGLQNRQLVKKKDPLALVYLEKCVAEQHSIKHAWNILMEDRFADLRRCIYQTEADRLRFRQLVINAVIATDIADRELHAWRQNRWNKAFHEQGDETTMDRKATILFEYILQASDVAPTMQHWHVYEKWNKRLFEERYIAFVLGHDVEDPSLKWYQGELDFFDNYVIPLAKNLKESNVFGLSCDDYLAYALENRREWEVKGEQLVSEMVSSHKSLVTQLISEHSAAQFYA